jgi:hypothetical protein
MSINKAAEELLKIADEIDQEAAQVTTFVCDKCNHTATMASINERRKAAAEEVNAEAADITVNDKLACPACDGVMAYQETEASKAYYFDPDKKAEAKDPDAPHDESKETPAEEKAESPETQKKEKEEGTEQHEQPKKAALDYDSLKRYASKK